MNRRSRPPVDPIDAVLADLAARLPAGAGGGRRGLLQEAEDGLRDAAEAYEQQGCTHREAAHRAAGEFGEPAALAPWYADDVLRLEARRTSGVLALGYLLVLTAWALLGRTAGHPEPRDHRWVTSSFAVLGVLAAAVAAAVFVACRRQARSGRTGGAVAWAAGVAGLLCGGATLLASYLVEPWGSRGSALPASPWTGPVEVLSALVVAVILLLSLRCLGAAWRVRHPARRG
ncbi:hypothetical protein SAMN04488543_1349 [Friedmanniella luteola]|uniref:Uncharacterized protein n=1 Tax=Friedmanniella luteola TaxID=546871 RepID=A0A1H1QKZ9_9ACTN|nr:hypothetical protein [Friedmanniella luteola]SDS24130.1 hypothetical protein SAMN04488543_1349 [Friedmanniella luteola]